MHNGNDDYFMFNDHINNAERESVCQVSAGVRGHGLPRLGKINDAADSGKCFLGKFKSEILPTLFIIGHL